MTAQDKIDLAGDWKLKLDPKNKGIEEAWFKKPVFSETVRLPGCLQAQGYGEVPNMNTVWWGGEKSAEYFEGKPWLSPYKNTSNFKIQEFLVPERHYLGVAWYTVEIDIPLSWQGKDTQLYLERCHWESQLWVDGNYFGKNQSLGTPHMYNLKDVMPGRHTLILRIDNSEIVNLGKKPHSVSEQTAGTWNGVVGKLELRATPKFRLENVQLYPDIDNQSVRVKGNIIYTGQNLKNSWKLTATVSGIAPNDEQPGDLQLEGQLDAGTEFEFDFPLGSTMKLWDEFDPNLYEMELSLTVNSDKELIKSTGSYRFGMRTFDSKGRIFTMNGIPTFLRGNVDCAVFPKTGYAPMDVTSWKKLFNIYKEYGLNMARFHSWCPPEAAFVAADEIGIYLAPEVGEWVGVNKQTQFDFLRNEASEILKTYGNHPSFVQFGLGNEANGKKEYFNELIEQWKRSDPRHLYTIKANSKGNPSNIDFEVVRGVGKPLNRIRYQSGWPPEPMNSKFHTDPPNTKRNWNEGINLREIPLIQHETAQITAYPDVLNELKKYTGYLHPTYLEIAAEQLKERGMLDQLPDFVEASGKWQVELTKEEFEAGFRTKDLAGFHWLCLADFTGQDTAPVGLTDAFYDTKPYVDPNQVQQWNAPTVILATLDKRVFSPQEDFIANILVSHHHKKNISIEATAKLKTTEGTLVDSWKLSEKEFKQGNAQSLGRVSTSLKQFKEPVQLVFEVTDEKNSLSNKWDVWVFPEVEVKKVPDFITVSKQWDEKVEVKLNQGETVLILPDQKDLKGELPICFTNYYWTSFGSNQGQSSAAGVLIDHKHEIFKNFPTANHSNWQWWDILTHAHPMILDSWDSQNPWPKSFKATIQPIDTWKINRKLGLLVEATVGKGKLIICAIDLENDLDQRPVTRFFRQNLLNYMVSDAFQPENEIKVEAIRELFKTKDE